MEFKHSPAPWHLRDGINERSILVDDNYNVIFASLDDIKKEDADLIAAAPELLEALIELTESAKEAIDGLGDLSDAIDTAKAAISKALGQQ
ncbi:MULTISPECIES: hypothetical protein [Providencia]|uniref:hypothetical protein n=1 Tax=Providencia TaxID=586 RepID=UPI001B397974|nr:MULTISPECIES: hypothetical protein [Providencia]MBQ0364978.1 hypothetical protein [Providencia rettgeri]MCG5279847.1 hypothetical protein [Providencia rettgeri]